MFRPRNSLGNTGGQFYTANNPTYGAVFTYHLKDIPKTSKSKRIQSERKLNADKNTVDAPVVNEPKAPRANDKTAYYNQLHEDHAASFNGPTLPDFIRPSEDGSRSLPGSM